MQCSGRLVRHRNAVTNRAKLTGVWFSKNGRLRTPHFGVATACDTGLLWIVLHMMIPCYLWCHHLEEYNKCRGHQFRRVMFPQMPTLSRIFKLKIRFSTALLSVLTGRNFVIPPFFEFLVERRTIQDVFLLYAAVFCTVNVSVTVFTVSSRFQYIYQEPVVPRSDVPLYYVFYRLIFTPRIYEI